MFLIFIKVQLLKNFFKSSNIEAIFATHFGDVAVLQWAEGEGGECEYLIAIKEPEQGRHDSLIIFNSNCLIRVLSTLVNLKFNTLTISLVSNGRHFMITQTIFLYLQTNHSHQMMKLQHMDSRTTIRWEGILKDYDQIPNFE